MTLLYLSILLQPPGSFFIPKKLKMVRHSQQVDEQQVEFDVVVDSSASSGPEEAGGDDSPDERRPSGLTKLSTAHQGTGFPLLNVSTTPS